MLMILLLFGPAVIIILVLFAVALGDPEAKTALGRGTLQVVHDIRLHHELRSWPQRIGRWTIFAVALIGIGLLGANLTTAADWVAGQFAH